MNNTTLNLSPIQLAALLDALTQFVDNSEDCDDVLTMLEQKKLAEARALLSVVEAAHAKQFDVDTILANIVED